jgi:hypothetical protein
MAQKHTWTTNRTKNRRRHLKSNETHVQTTFWILVEKFFFFVSFFLISNSALKGWGTAGKSMLCLTSVFVDF